MTASPISIVPATPSHAETLLAFEVTNRAYFEQWIAPRADAFYNLAYVRETLAQAVDDRASDRAYSYLAFADAALVGRVNLRHVQRPLFNRAVLGYRIGERYTGRGYATEAVRHVLDEAFGPLQLWRVEAVVRDGNPGSHRVLTRNHFRAFGRSTRSVQHEGAWYDLHHYERHRA